MSNVHKIVQKMNNGTRWLSGVPPLNVKSACIVKEMDLQSFAKYTWGMYALIVKYLLQCILKKSSDRFQNFTNANYIDRHSSLCNNIITFIFGFINCTVKTFLFYRFLKFVKIQ